MPIVKNDPSYALKIYIVELPIIRNYMKKSKVVSDEIQLWIPKKVLACFARLAQRQNYVYSDPNSCIYKLGMFGERLILEIFAFEHIPEPTNDNTHANRIRLLKREGLIPKKIDDILYALRKNRNDAVHNGSDSVEIAKTLLRMNL